MAPQVIYVRRRGCMSGCLSVFLLIFLVLAIAYPAEKFPPLWGLYAAIVGLVIFVKVKQRQLKKEAP